MPGPEPLILVIEDEAPIRKFLRATLCAHGFRVAEAATGKEGLIQAGMTPPQAIILDLGLPDVDGLDVLRRVREWCSAPVIVKDKSGELLAEYRKRERMRTPPSREIANIQP